MPKGKKNYAKQKTSNLGPKCLIFSALSLKNYCRIWNQHRRICQNAKFHAKLKTPNFGTIKCLIYLPLGCNFKEKLLSYRVRQVRQPPYQNFFIVSSVLVGVEKNSTFYTFKWIMNMKFQAKRLIHKDLLMIIVLFVSLA